MGVLVSALGFSALRVPNAGELSESQWTSQRHAHGYHVLLEQGDVLRLGASDCANQARIDR